MRMVVPVLVELAPAVFPATMVVRVAVRLRVAVRQLGALRLTLFMRVGVPPKHHLLDHEKDPQTQDERGANPVRARGSNTLNRLGQKREQRGAQQRTRRKADQVGQETCAGALRQQQESTREGGAGDAAER